MMRPSRMPATAAVVNPQANSLAVTWRSLKPDPLVK